MFTNARVQTDVYSNQFKMNDEQTLQQVCFCISYAILLFTHLKVSAYKRIMLSHFITSIISNIAFISSLKYYRTDIRLNGLLLNRISFKYHLKAYGL